MTSSLLNSYNKITNNGVPTGPIVSDVEHQILGSTEMMTTTDLNAGAATISINNGGGFETEDMVDGIAFYDLKNCTFKITLTVDATVATS